RRTGATRPRRGGAGGTSINERASGARDGAARQCLDDTTVDIGLLVAHVEPMLLVAVTIDSS
ncbi:MAG: hypothetical protein M3Y09_19675, partial [Actinomycetota bacterium]|nr:hypothetical protein [Actinomycetota bacterium]